MTKPLQAALAQPQALKTKHLSNDEVPNKKIRIQSPKKAEMPVKEQSAKKAEN